VVASREGRHAGIEVQGGELFKWCGEKRSWGGIPVYSLSFSGEGRCISRWEVLHGRVRRMGLVKADERDGGDDEQSLRWGKAHTIVTRRIGVGAGEGKFEGEEEIIEES